MIITITGGAGFIGSNLVEKLLLSSDHTLNVIDAFTSDLYPKQIKMKNVDGFKDNSRVKIFDLDLRTGELDEALVGSSVVIHLAALAGLPKSWEIFDKYSSCNLLATQRLLESIGKLEIPKLLYISTSSVYGENAIGDENMHLRPVSPYGVTKLASEHIIDAYSNIAKFEYSILRLFSVYGPKQRPDMAYNIIINKFLNGEPFQVFGDGRQSRSNTYVSDIVDGITSAMFDFHNREIYNLCGSEKVELNSAIEIIRNLTRSKSTVEYLGLRAGDQGMTFGDFTKAKSHFGYSPKVSFLEGIERQIAWQKNSR